MATYDHLVQVDESSGEVRIFRVDAEGHKTLYTANRLPLSEGWSQELTSFARALGENLLLDSPVARKVLKL